MTARDHRVVRWFFALVSVCYFGVYPYLQAINNPNENTRVYLVIALVDHGTFRLDDVVRRYGWTNDMAKVPDAGAAGGSHLAAVKGPALAYLGVPVYAAQKLVLGVLGRRAPDLAAPAERASWWLRTTTITLETVCVHAPCFLFLVWLERRLRRWSGDLTLRLATVAAVGLGTNYLAYSLVFVSHAWSAAITFAALEVVAIERVLARGAPARARPAAAFLAGFLASAITLFEYQGLFVSIVAALYAISIFRRPRTLGAFALGGLVNVLALMLFQWRSFGSPLTPGHRMMETEAFRELQHQGLFGITLPHADAIAGLLFDGGYGLFGTSPFAWLALVGVAALALSRAGGIVARERRRAALAFALAFAVLVTSVSAAVIWRGGWTIGPRYLGAAPPLVAVVALAGLSFLSCAAPRARWAIRALAVGLAGASIARGGAIGLVVSTLPEAIVRPVAQILVPFLRLAIVPHHALELFGVSAAWPAFVPLFACTAAFAVVAAGARGPRVVVGAIVIAALAAWPAFVLPKSARDDGPDVRALFYAKWEPTGRDALARARLRAERDPCAWRDVARAELVLGRPREAELASQRASGCAR